MGRGAVCTWTSPSGSADGCWRENHYPEDSSGLIWPGDHSRGKCVVCSRLQGLTAAWRGESERNWCPQSPSCEEPAPSRADAGHRNPELQETSAVTNSPVRTHSANPEPRKLRVRGRAYLSDLSGPQHPTLKCQSMQGEECLEVESRGLQLGCIVKPRWGHITSPINLACWGWDPGVSICFPGDTNVPPSLKPMKGSLNVFCQRPDSISSLWLHSLFPLLDSATAAGKQAKQHTRGARVGAAASWHSLTYRPPALGGLPPPGPQQPCPAGLWLRRSVAVVWYKVSGATDTWLLMPRDWTSHFILDSHTRLAATALRQSKRRDGPDTPEASTGLTFRTREQGLRSGPGWRFQNCREINYTQHSDFSPIVKFVFFF